jgi:hypothetical protein
VVGQDAEYLVAQLLVEVRRLELDSIDPHSRAAALQRDCLGLANEPSAALAGPAAPSRNLIPLTSASAR